MSIGLMHYGMVLTVPTFVPQQDRLRRLECASVPLCLSKIGFADLSIKQQMPV